ncbi:MAG: UDP-N-acetylglucosamine diphosphorylase [Puniceicoccales bacterium]|jgi:NDP-sugar pyrophosphorylase family protein|nr:UDP-N-acetylglucosamine diphosphorylase [Puniceicoccales bacterium]
MKAFPKEIFSGQLFASLGSLEFLRPFFPENVPPWEWLRNITKALDSLEIPKSTADVSVRNHIAGRVFIHPTATVGPFATIVGPAYVGAHAEIRSGALVRGNCIIGERCAIGSGCEIKNMLALDGTKIAHFNYVGDSVLGKDSHLGAGAILSNLRFDRREVLFRLGKGKYPTHLRKFGSILGDDAQVGCNGVLQPGTILGRGAVVHPGVVFGGYLPPTSTARSSVKPLDMSPNSQGMKEPLRV